MQIQVQPEKADSEVDRLAPKHVILLCLCLMLVSGCSNSSLPHARIEEARQDSPRRFLPSFRSDWGLTARSVLSCPSGECIVLHHPIRFVRIKGIRDGRLIDDYEREVKILLVGDPNTEEDNGEILHEDSDVWSTDDALGGSQVTFNCCTYAIADVVGLKNSDWIAPNALDATENTVPMQILLDSYFQLIHTEPASEIDWRRLESDQAFEDGDIFCFVYSKKDWHEFAHVGKILPKDGRNWLVGKLGRGPVVRSSLGAAGEIYQGEFDQIRVYRRLAHTF